MTRIIFSAILYDHKSQQERTMEIQKIQEYLIEHNLNGWLLADFHSRNSIAMDVLKIDGMVTRRSFFYIPAEGEPIMLSSFIDSFKFKGAPGKFVVFRSYKELERNLEKILPKGGKLAMEYSENNRLPYIGLVDAGTIELIRSFGCDIVSSADMVANFQARLSTEQIATHRIAANNVIDIKNKAFDFISNSLKEGKKINEYDVVRFILKQFDDLDMETEHDPCVSIGPNASIPHYEPTDEASSEIKMGDLVLIDLWGKLRHQDGVFADITWMGFAGSKDEMPKEYTKLFEIVKNARDTAIEFIRSRIDNQPVFGAGVDDACRAVIEEAGYGQYFTHRTGHSITSEVHGTGPNIDNLETEDSRKLQKGHLFSVEPGIYLPEYGMRSEINVLIGHNGVEVTTIPLQEEILTIFE
jgi:Xaa-Pro aminopeptidase